MLNITKYRVTVELIEPLLGTVPRRKEVYADFIATRAAQHAEKNERFASGEEATGEVATELAEEETECIKELEEKGWTGFHEDDEGPFLFDYAIKGFLSESARTLKEADSEGSDKKLKQLQDKFKRYVFVKPRRVRLPAIMDKPLERPLRAMTAQGPRVTVTRSDQIAEGARITFDLWVLHGGGITLPIIKDVLEYGGLIGFGQWRSGGYGRFDVVSIEEL